MSTMIFLISSAFQTYEVYLLMQCFLKKCRIGGKGVLCAYAGLYLMLTLPNLVLGIPMVNLIFSFGSELFITMLYKESWKKGSYQGFLFLWFLHWQSVLWRSYPVILIWISFHPRSIFQHSEQSAFRW